MPFLKNIIIDDQTKIKIWKVTLGELSHNELNNEDKKLLKKKRSGLLREQFLATRKMLALENSDYKITYDLVGKPNLNNEYNISISNVKNELIRLDKAVKKTILDFKKIINKIQSTKNDVYEEMKLVLEANIYLLSSSSFIKDAKKRISNDLINAEFAINEELNKQFKIFNKIKDDYLKDRFDDVRDVCKRILDNLQKKKFF